MTTTPTLTGPVPSAPPPAVRAEEFHFVRPAAVTRARALLDGDGWADDDVVAAVAAVLLAGDRAG